MKRLRILHLLRSLMGDRKGVAAIEFALLILPLSMLIFGIIEISLMFFVESSLDASVQKISRMIRTGEVASSNVTLADFKTRICSDMLLAFGCADDLLVKVDVVSNLSTTAAATAIDSTGKLAVTETYTIGKASDYILVQAFLPWDSAVNFFTFSTDRLADGRYLLASSALFRNEPF